MPVSSDGAYTLVEIAIVVAVIAVIMVMGILNCAKSGQRSSGNTPANNSRHIYPARNGSAIHSKYKSGLTLVESLISMLLLGTLLSGILAAFFISKMSASRAKHRIMAMKYIRNSIEQEMKAGYDGGSDAEADYYSTVVSAAPASVTIDDRGTVSTADDLIGTIAPDPYPAHEYGGVGITYAGIDYKIVGFVVTWTEDVTNQVCTERGVAYVASHP